MLFKVLKNAVTVNYVSLCVDTTTKDFLHKRDYIRSYNDRIKNEDHRFNWMSCAAVLRDGSISFNGTTITDTILVLSEQVSEKRKIQIKEEIDRSFFDNYYSNYDRIKPCNPSEFPTYTPRGGTDSIRAREDSLFYDAISNIVVNNNVTARPTWTSNTFTTRPGAYIESHPISVNGEIPARGILGGAPEDVMIPEEEGALNSAISTLRDLYRRNRGGM